MTTNKDTYGLIYLPYHLAASDAWKDLQNLIDDEAFRIEKLAVTGSIEPLCRDIRLVFDETLDHLDLPLVTKYGFMHTDYVEGRFGKADILQLHSIDPEKACREIRLYHERPRFRLFVLLAQYEAKAGRQNSAIDLVKEALALKGVELPDNDADYVASAVTRLLNYGILEAVDLLRTAFQPSLAAQLAARIAAHATGNERTYILRTCIRWLDQVNRLSIQFNSNVADAFEAISEEMIKVTDQTHRQDLLRSLENYIQTIRTPREEGEANFNYALIMVAGGVMNNDEGIQIKMVLQALLGAALIRGGETKAGIRLFDVALDTHMTEIFPNNFGVLTRVALSVPRPHRIHLLCRIIDQTFKSKDSKKGKAFILEALANGSDPEDAGECVDLLLKQRISGNEVTTLMAPIVKVFLRAGRRPPVVNMPIEQVALFGWNVFIPSEKRLHLVQGLLTAGAIAGQYDLLWVRKWLLRMLKWIMRLHKLKDKKAELNKLVELCSWIDQFQNTETIIQIIDSIIPDDLRAEVLLAFLKPGPMMGIGNRFDYREQVYRWCLDLKDTAKRFQVWAKWLDDAGIDEEARIREIWTNALQGKGSGIQIECLGKVAGVLGRLGHISDADEAWKAVAVKDQELLAISHPSASWAVSKTITEKDDDWRSILNAIKCPDPEFVGKTVEAAASSCRDIKRLSKLEKQANRFCRIPGMASPHLLMDLAIARALSNLGKYRRGARLALRSLRRRRYLIESKANSEKLREVEFRELVATGLALRSNAWGRNFLLMVVPVAFSEPEALYRVSYLANAIALCADSGWAEIGFKELLRYTDTWIRNNDKEGSWVTVDVVAGIAAAIAKSGRFSWAYDILSSLSFPKPRKEDDLLNSLINEPINIAAALLSLARAADALENCLTRDASRTIVRALEAAYRDLQRLRVNAIGDSSVEASATGARSIALSIVRAFATECPIDTLENKWYGFRVVAYSLARDGNGEAALHAAREVSSAKYRDSLLEDLVDELANYSIRSAAACWREISSLPVRHRASQALARKWLFECADTLKIPSNQSRPPHLQRICLALFVNPPLRQLFTISFVVYCLISGWLTPSLVGWLWG